ncbi:MAG: diacylglycerol/lipid kinase family protein [Candidatus Aminicenantales bacterium]
MKKGQVKVILNPLSGKGHGAKVEFRIRHYLREEGIDFDLVKTEGPWHAVKLAEEASRGGYVLIVAAGGDGTVHEVVNGLMAASEGGVAGTLGIIPVGSGSDFAHAINIPHNPRKACQRLAHGRPRLVDVGLIKVDKKHTRYFDNTVNIGFGGVVTIEAQKIKHLRGTALYLPVVLKTVFLYYRAPLVDIEYDGQKLKLPAVMICICNGPREGGGFFVAPEARPDDGLFDLCITREVSRLSMLAHIPRFMKGTHVNSKPVKMARARVVKVTSKEPLVAHADGEILCRDSHSLEFELLPGRLRVWS